MSVEKRRHPRFKAAHRTWCYLDGTRFDAQTPDIGAGGVFLRTDDPIPVGMLVVVVLDGEIGMGELTHLVGRVVRTQREPVAGVGVRWLRAVSVHSEERLRSFLASSLGMAPDAAAGRIRAQGRLVEFEFEAEEDSAVLPPTPPAITRVSPRFTRGSAPGPITGFFQVEALVPAHIPAQVVVGGRPVRRVTLVWLGSTRVVASEGGAIGESPPGLELVVPVMTREGIVRLRLTGAWAGRPGVPDAPFDIEKIDDQEAPGLYDRYLKWLREKELAGTPAGG